MQKWTRTITRAIKEVEQMIMNHLPLIQVELIIQQVISTFIAPNRQRFNIYILIDVSRGTTPADLRDGTESIAGSESNAATPTHERSRRKDDQRNKSWLKNINLLWREIANHKNGAMFMNPIKENIAPHYYEIVKRPMDLKAIKNRIRDGVRWDHILIV